MKPACPRLFEVEALRDGRLSGAEAARVETHLGICSVCAQEARSLEALAKALRLPHSVPNELHVRRERTRLLAAFDANLVPTPRNHRFKPWWAAVAALAVLGIFVPLSWPDQPPAAVKPNTATMDPIRIRADSVARWSRVTNSQFEKLALENGTLSIRVDHTRASRRLLIVLPDGELEDIGTTFSVTVEGGRTTHITVQEGSVVLRLRGNAALALGAGQTWSPALAAQKPAVIAPSTPSATPSAAPSPKPARPAGVAAAPAPSHSATQPTPQPSLDFRSAMSAFNAGDNRQAAALFSAFITQHPRDPRAEDAAYLRVLALRRLGDSSEARAAAGEYLRHYPQGFRRAEIEALTR